MLGTAGVYYNIPFIKVLRIQSRASCTLGRHSPAELHPQQEVDFIMMLFNRSPAHKLAVEFFCGGREYRNVEGRRNTLDSFLPPKFFIIV